MTKKATATAPVVEVTSTEVSTSTFQTDITISKEDVIQVAVNEIEETLESVLSDTMVAYRKADKLVNKLTKEVEEELKELVTVDMNEIVLKLTETFGSTYGFDKEGKNVNTQILSSEVVSEKGNLQIHSSIDIASGKFSGAFTSVLSLKHTKYPELKEKLSKALKSAEKLANDVGTIRMRLRDIPKTERKARATLAKSQLKNTTQGSDMLALLRDTDFLGKDISAMIAPID